MDKFIGYVPTWCPGCGNFGINAALRSALNKMELTPDKVFFSFGIGCSGNSNDFINGFSIHGLHGRAIPTAIGMKIANHDMTTIAIVGDGDFYGEGGNHFLHGCRGNHDITVIVHNNNVYGLTTGQVAPTAAKGYKSKSTPLGIIEQSINPLALAISQGATFVAQGFSGDVLGLSEIIKQAISHKGFSLVNILQPCISFNKVNTYEYFKSKSYLISEKHDKSSINQALELSMQPILEQKLPLGVIYKAKRSIYTEQLPQIKNKTLSQNKHKCEGVNCLLEEISLNFK